jgi:hypothetical protein
MEEEHLMGEVEIEVEASNGNICLNRAEILAAANDRSVKSIVITLRTHFDWRSSLGID